MKELDNLTPDELKAMAADIAQISNQYNAAEGKGCKLSLVEFSGSRKTGVEVFASDVQGNGLLTVKVTLNRTQSMH